MNGNSVERKGRVDCHACSHFHVTWEPSRPYGCRLMGFKSKFIPSLEVFRADGQECRGFTPKPGHVAADLAAKAR